MRKLILVLVMLVLSALPVGCDPAEKGMTVCGSATELTEGLDGARMIYLSSDETSLTVRIENGTEAIWQSGNMRNYELQVQRSDGWYRVEQIGELANTMELIIFLPGESMDHTFSFTERYGVLESGRYRVVKSFWANYDETGEDRAFDLVLEFDIEA